MKSSYPGSLVFLNAPRKPECSDPLFGVFCVSIAKPSLLCFFLVQTASPPQTGGTSMLQTKVYPLHVVSMFYTKSKQQEVSGQSTQACWDYQGPNITIHSTSASWLKANLDLPVRSGLLSMKEKLDSGGVWSAIADPSQHFIIFSFLSCGFHNTFYVKFKEIPSANITTSVLYRFPQSFSYERYRTRVAWRQIVSEWQKHPELWRHLKTLHREHDVRWGYLSKTMHIHVQIPPTPYFLHLC